MGVSQREFAALWGKSRGAVQKAITSGRIRIEPDGSIHADRALAALRGNTDPAQSRSRNVPPRTRPVPSEAVGAVGETLREQGLPSGGPMTFLEARTVNEVLKAHERRPNTWSISLSFAATLDHQTRCSWIAFIAPVILATPAEATSG
jgi:hypothetical protein